MSIVIISNNIDNIELSNGISFTPDVMVTAMTQYLELDIEISFISSMIISTRRKGPLKVNGEQFFFEIFSLAPFPPFVYCRLLSFLSFFFSSL
jgi:hypothetical protein